MCHLNLCIKKWGSRSSFRRKRPVISLNCSVFLENLSSSGGARANHAKNDAQKGCAMQLKGITLLTPTGSAHRAFIPRDRAIPVEVQWCKNKISGVFSCCFCISLFNFRCGSVDPQMGNVIRKRNGRFMKESRLLKRQRLRNEKQTLTPAADNK